MKLISNQNNQITDSFYNHTVWSWVNKSREVRILSVWYIWSENPVVQNIWRFTVSQINVLVFFGFLTRLGMSSSLVLGYSVKTLCSFPWIHKHSSSTSTSISSTSFKTSNISFIDNIGNQVTSGPKWVNIKWAALICLCHHIGWKCDF